MPIPDFLLGYFEMAKQTLPELERELKQLEHVVYNKRELNAMYIQSAFGILEFGAWIWRIAHDMDSQTCPKMCEAAIGAVKEQLLVCNERFRQRAKRGRYKWAPLLSDEFVRTLTIEDLRAYHYGSFRIRKTEAVSRPKGKAE